MSSAPAICGGNDDPAGTGLAAPHGEENGTLPDASAAPSTSGAPISVDARANRKRRAAHREAAPEGSAPPDRCTVTNR